MTVEAARVPDTGKTGWTIETAIDHLTSLVNERDGHVRTLIAGMDKRVEDRFAAIKEAVLKAENATERRFESVNEFRGTLDNQQRTLIPRAEVDVIVKGLEGKIDTNTKQLAALNAERMGIRGGWGYAIGLLGAISIIGSLFAFALKLGGH